MWKKQTNEKTAKYNRKLSEETSNTTSVYKKNS